MARFKKLRAKFQPLDNSYLVIKNFLGLLLIFVGVLGFFSVARESELSRALVVLMYIIVALLAFALICEYVIKTLRLQKEERVKRYSAIVALNTIFGLVFPLFVINILTNKIIYWLAMFKNYNTWICEVRFEIINLYKSYDVYHTLYLVILWTLIISIALFIWGGVFERNRK